MKKLYQKALYRPGVIICVALALLGSQFTSQVQAQSKHVELTPFAGYLLGGSVKFIEGKFKIMDNLCYGGNLSYMIREGYHIELSYTRMDTKGEWRSYSGYSFDYPDKDVTIAVNYIMLGTLKEIPVDNDKLKPFGLFQLGATWFAPSGTDASDTWLFSIAAGAGLKVFFSERVGIRLQARLLLPMFFSGGGFYVGTGGSGVAVSSTSPVVEGDFTGGLIIVLGK